MAVMHVHNNEDLRRITLKSGDNLKMLEVFDRETKRPDGGINNLYGRAGKSEITVDNVHGDKPAGTLGRRSEYLAQNRLRLKTSGRGRSSQTQASTVNLSENFARSTRRGPGYGRRWSGRWSLAMMATAALSTKA